MIFEVNSGALTDLFVDGRFSDEAENGETVVRTIGGVGEVFLGTAARFRLRRKCVEETLREEL